MNNTTDCPFNLPHTILLMEDIGYIVIIPVICIIGITLNIPTALAFWRFSPLLLIFRAQLFTRSLADTVTLVLVLPLGVLRCRTCDPPVMNSSAWLSFSNVYQYNIYVPVANFSATCSIWLTALVSAQRCITIKHNQLLSKLKNRIRNSSWIAVLIVLIFSLVITAPYFVTSIGHQDNVLDFLGHSTDAQFQIYTWIRISLAKFIPTALVAVVNVLLGYHIWRARKRRLSQVDSVSDDNKQARNERTLTVMLIGISFGFLLAHIPESFSNSGVYRSFFGQCSVYEPPFRIFRLTCNVLEMLSYSLNFCIYYIWNEQFRRLAKAMLKCAGN